MITKRNSTVVDITNMTRLYLRALKIEDTTFIKLFEGMFPEEDNIDFKAIQKEVLITKNWVTFPQQGDK